MKKLLTILLSLLMVLTLAACGGNGAKEKSKMEVAKEAGKITIASVVNGTLGDKSFFDSAEEAVQWMNRDFGDKVYAETIELTYDKSTWADGLAEVCSQGWDVIICGTYDMKEHVINCMADYPDQTWWFYDEEWNFDNPEGWQYAPCDSLYAIMFAQNEGSYVVGYMASMLSESHKVAFMGGQNNTVLDDFYVGFANGAKAQNPETSVNCSWMNSFNDATVGKDVSQGLYNAGYDVVFACGGSAGLGGFDQVITEAEGKYIIGVDGDQGAYFASLGTEEGNAKAARTITSMKKNVNQGLYDTCKAMLDGTLAYGTNKKLGIAGGYVSYAVTDTTKALFTAEQLAEIEEISQKVSTGEIDPGTAFGHEAGWFDEFVATQE